MRQTYRLTPKLVTLIVGAGLLSMAIALVLVFSVQKKALTESLGHQFEVLANITSARLTNLLDQTFSEATLLGLDPLIREAVEDANRRYAGRSPAQIQAEINRLQAQWNTKTVTEELGHRYKDSRTAMFLRRYLEQPAVARKYLTILVADRYGMLVTSPYKPDDINFSNQEWWRAAYKDGAGGYYASDVSLAALSPEMDKTYMIQFAVPIIAPQGQQAIGALVVVSTVSHLFAAVTGLRMGQNDHVMLANSSGVLIFCPVFLVKNHTLKAELVQAISKPTPGWTQTRFDVHYQGLTLNGHAPVTTTTILNPASFGGQRWYIFTSQDPKETYAPMTRLLTWVAVAGTGGLGLLGITAFFIARRFTQPIRELQEGAKLIGFGNLDYRLTIPTGDEIEELSYEFNEMATKLKTAYTNLEQRVAQRTRELEDRNRQLSILYAVSSSLSAATEIKGLLSTALATTTQQLGSLITFIHLVDDAPLLHGSHPHTPIANRGALEREVIEACKECMQPPAQAVRLKQVVVRGELPPPPAGAPSGNSAQAGTGEASILLTIPLLSKNRIMGAMALWYPQGSGLRLEHDRYLLLTLGHQIGAAIEAAQLFEQTKKLDQLKSEFVSKVSHELRTPLTSIKGFGEILASYDDIEPANRQEFIQIINEESDRLTRLINDLLDLSKIEAGKIEWIIQPIDMGQILRYTVKQVQAMTLKKPLTLVLNLPPSLPLAMGDRDQLVQVMENLLSNAVKFTPQGTITVGASWEPAATAADPSATPKLTVFVQDSGIGIPEHELAPIFEKFHQITDANRTLPKGTGLGLALCREIINHMHGDIWAESTLGRGSRFFFTLPLATPVALRPTAEPATTRAGSS